MPQKFSAEKKLILALKKREDQNSLRELKNLKGLIDFSSNDYLGYARTGEPGSTSEDFIKELNKINGSTGSRLLTGNSEFAEDLESYIASYHNAEAGLIFNSGYDANIGLFSSIAATGDTIIYDEFVHASIHDGIKLSKANAYAFRHNDLTHFEERLKISTGTIFVAVESVYSMDGDFGDLKEIAVLSEKYNANLIVDEAHATGIFGEKGEGKIVELNLEDKVFARVHTFGKALGTHGAIVLGSETLRNFLINFSRSFIYTTALPLHTLHTIKNAYLKLAKDKTSRNTLHNLINVFKENIYNEINLVKSDSPIQCVIIGGNENTKSISEELRNSGFDVRPILSPTVPKKTERLRICLHSFNTESEIIRLTESLLRLQKDRFCNLNGIKHVQIQ